MSSSSHESVSRFQKNLVFINDVDFYHGKYIAEHIYSLFYTSAVGFPIFEDYGEDGPPVVTEDLPEQKNSLITHETSHKKPNDLGESSIFIHYEVIGTVKDRFVKELPGVKELIPPEDYLDAAIKAGILILDISQSLESVPQVEKILGKLEDDLTTSVGDVAPNIRRVILISTILTWSETDLESEEERVLNEDQYQQRKPLDAYLVHYNIEEKVIDLGNKFKDYLQTVVVTAGLTYGCEEDIFAMFFQMAWEAERVIPIFGSGQNNLPLIHVKDLAYIVGSLIQSFPTKRNVFAVEKDSVKLQDVIIPIGQAFGSGYFKYVSKEESIFMDGISSHSYYLLTANVKMEPTNFITSEEEPIWTHTGSFTVDLHALWEEFKSHLNLKPHKLLLFGPPASGKSKLASTLSIYYGISVYSQDILNSLIIEELKWKLHLYSHLKAEEEDLNDDDVEKENCYFSTNEENIDDIKSELRSIQDLPELPTDVILKYLCKKLVSSEFKNKGWIFDGFPKLYEECLKLFGENFEPAENDDEVAEEAMDTIRKVTLPDIIISLGAPDLFLCERVMLLREQAIINTPYNEKDMLKNLKLFKKVMSAAQTLLTYFQDANVEILQIDLTEKNMTIEHIFDMIADRVGEPSTSYIKEDVETQSEIDLHHKQAETHRIDRLKESVSQENEEKIKEWTNLYRILKKEEAERIRIHSDALRQYLVEQVFPLLVKGLAVVAKVRPADPIDFLAEYLFRENASGKIFDPSYNFCADHLMILFDEITRYTCERKT